MQTNSIIVDSMIIEKSKTNNLAATEDFHFIKFLNTRKPKVVAFLRGCEKFKSLTLTLDASGRHPDMNQT